MEILDSNCTSKNLLKSDCPSSSNSVLNLDNLEESEVFVGDDEEVQASIPTSAIGNNEEKEEDNNTDGKEETELMEKPKTDGEDEKENKDSKEDNGEVSSCGGTGPNASRRMSSESEFTGLHFIPGDTVSLPFDTLMLSASCETSIISIASSMEYEADSIHFNGQSRSLMMASLTDEGGSEEILGGSCHGSESDVSRSVNVDTIMSAKLTSGKKKRVVVEDPASNHRRSNSIRDTDATRSRSANRITTRQISEPKPPCTCGSNSGSSTPRTHSSVPATPRSSSLGRTRSASSRATSATREKTTKSTPKPQSANNNPKQTLNSSMRVRSATTKPSNADPTSSGAPNNYSALRRKRMKETSKDAGDSSSQDSRGSGGNNEPRFAFGRSIPSTRTSPETFAEKSSTMDKYGTLPRRKKPPQSSITTVETASPASRPTSREPSITRSSLLRFWKTKEDLDNKEKMGGGSSWWGGGNRESRFTKTATSLFRGGGATGRSLPPLPKNKESGTSTLICAEASVQTVLTLADTMDKVLSVSDLSWRPSSCDQSIQTTETTEIEDLKKLLAEERAEKAEIQKELATTTQRVTAMLENMEGVEKEFSSRSETLQDLQAQLHVSNKLITQLQEEANYYRNTCRTLQQDLEKSISSNRAVHRQLQETESESKELQDFLQAEKNMFSEALKEAENEVTSLRDQLTQKESDLKQQQAQCHHLVRISEQRRHEYLLLQSQTAGEQGRAQDLLLQQGADVSSAAMALTDLSARLEALLAQLVLAYEIEEGKEEKLVSPIQNGSHYPSNKRLSLNGDIRKNSISPKKGMLLVNAVHHVLKNVPPVSNGIKSKTLESDTNIVNKKESDITPVKNGHSNGEALESPVPRLIGSESLQNLSAIIQERHNSKSTEEEDLLNEDEGERFLLTDQITELDQLVHRLLKTLQIIQLDSDNIIDQVYFQKMNLEHELEELKGFSGNSSSKNYSSNESAVSNTQLQQEVDALHERLVQKESSLENLKQQLARGKKALNTNWSRSVSEVQRLQGIVVSVKETLQGIPSVVTSCPKLSKLQHDLENTSTFPVLRRSSSNASEDDSVMTFSPPPETNGSKSESVNGQIL